MDRRLLLAGIAFLATQGASAAGPLPADTVRAAERCESAVADTVRRMRGRDAQEVEFLGGRRLLSPTGDAEETGVKGEGRYHGPRQAAVPFTYSCAFNARTGATSGVVFRETGGADPGVAAAWEPDLRAIEPEDCETAAASELKRKYPRVARIAFGSDSRALRPAPNDLTSLEGQGAVQRAPGMHSVPFRYRCAIETRSGRVVSVETDD